MRSTARMQIERAVVVDAHIEDVFDYLADRRRETRWWADVVAVEQLVGDGPGLGTRYGVTLRRGRRVTATCVAYERPAHLAWREDDDSGGAAHIAYDLSSVWTATRVTRSEDPGEAGPLARRRRARAAARALSRLSPVFKRR